MSELTHNGTRFVERQAFPIWVPAAAFFLAAALAAVPAGLAVAEGTSRAVASFAIVAFGFAIALTVTVGNARRVIRVDDRCLYVGKRVPVRLADIQATAVVDGKDLRRVRRRLLSPKRSGATTTAAGSAAIIGLLGSPAGLAAPGAVEALVSGASRYGVACPPWADKGLLILAPPEPVAPPESAGWQASFTRPALWLIATERPDELKSALEESP